MLSDHLNYETFYKIVELNFNTEVIKGQEIAKIIEKYQDNVTKKEKDILQVSHITQVISMASLQLANLI